jgi:hypothetical protein
MRGPTFRAFGIVFLVAVGSRAEAPVDTGLRIQVANCPDELAARLPAVVKLEIDVLLRERGPARVPPETIAVRCEEDRARIDVSMAGASQSSSIDLRVLAAEHRPRAVALAAAELVHSMSSRAPPPEPAPSPPAVHATPIAPEGPDRVAREPAPPAPRRPTLMLGALVELLGKPVAPLIGGRLSFQLPAGSVLAPAISIDGAIGSVHARSADVKIESGSAAAHLYFGTTSGNVRWELGPGARIALAHLAGQPPDGSGLEGHALTAPWGGPEARARVAFAPVHSPAFALELGAGLVALPVRGLLDGTQRVYSLEGPWASICAELGLGL